MRRKNNLNITFDTEARREYLTGFSKRKQQKKLSRKAAYAEKQRKATRELKRVKNQNYKKILIEYMDEQDKIDREDIIEEIHIQG